MSRLISDFDEAGAQTGQMDTVSILRRSERLFAALSTRVRHLPPEAADAALYFGSAVFAVLTFEISSIAIYKWWGEMAALPYLIAAIASAWTVIRPPRRRSAFRIAIVMLVFVTAVLVPLLAQIVDQAGSLSTIAHAQPEVLVIEAAGSRLVTGKALYPVIHSAGAGLASSSSVPLTNAFFPYLPGMALFGIGSALIHKPAALGDPRLGFVLITLFATILAIIWRPRTKRSPMLAFQAMAILPTAALPLVTGGDDIPVVALMALGIVLLARQKWGWSGIVLGLAAILKFTAWPLVIIAGIVLAVRNGWRTGLKLALPALTIMTWTLGREVIHNLSALVNNVIKFPAGIASLKSPAASPLPGHILDSIWRGYPKIAFAIGIAIGIATLVLIIYRTPKVHTGASWLSALVLFIAILIAPATRVGYLLYPVDLAAWAWVLTTTGEPLKPNLGKGLAGGRHLLQTVSAKGYRDLQTILTHRSGKATSGVKQVVRPDIPNPAAE